MVQYALKKCSPGRIYHFHAARKYRLAACRAWFFAFASALGLFQGISLSRATTGAAADLEIYGGYENIFTFDYLKRMATEYILPFKYNPVHGLTFYNAEEYYHLIVDRPDLMYS